MHWNDLPWINVVRLSAWPCVIQPWCVSQSQLKTCGRSGTQLVDVRVTRVCVCLQACVYVCVSVCVCECVCVCQACVLSWCWMTVTLGVSQFALWRRFYFHKIIIFCKEFAALPLYDFNLAQGWTQSTHSHIGHVYLKQLLSCSDVLTHHAVLLSQSQTV